jgi:xylose isomerase
MRKLAELGAYGVTFHDNDVFDFDASDSERDKQISAFRQALADTGLVVTTATTNLFGHPMFKEGAFTANDREVRRYALAKVMRNLDLAAELGAGSTCNGAAGKAPSRAPARTCGQHVDRYKEAIDVLCAYVLDHEYAIRFALEPKPNEPRGDILLPTAGHALAFINELERPDSTCHPAPSPWTSATTSWPGAVPSGHRRRPPSAAATSSFTSSMCSGRSGRRPGLPGRL